MNRFTGLLIFAVVCSIVGAAGLISAKANDYVFGRNSTPPNYNAPNNIAWSIIGKQELPTTRTPGTADPFAEFYPCDAEVQADSFDKLSAAERMLAIGYKVSGGEKGPYSRYDHGVKPVSFMADFIGQFYFRNGRMPVSTEEMFRYMDEQSGRVDSAGLYQLLVSPVTVKPLEWNHESFSRGNAFITVINDNPEALSVAEARHEQLEKKYPKTSPKA